MAATNTRGLINGIIYSLMYERQPDDQTVDRVAEMILRERGLTGGPQAHYDALSSVLEAGQLPGMIESDHSQATLLEFLRKLRDRLDSLRPWQPPPWVVVPIKEWDARPQRAIARLDLTAWQVSNRLPAPPFSPLPQGDGALTGMLLRLASGQTVGLLGSVQKDGLVTLLQSGGEGDPAATIDEFAEVTGIPREQITPLLA